MTDQLWEEMQTIDTSLFYLIVIIAAILLSFYATVLQRGQLAGAIAGEECDSPAVFPIRLSSGVMIVCALVFFFRLAGQTLSDAEAPQAACSARISYLASALVLAAALLRLCDLLRTGPGGASDADSSLPD